MRTTRECVFKKSRQKSAKKCLEFFVNQMQFKNELLESRQTIWTISIHNLESHTIAFCIALYFLYKRRLMNNFD